MNLSQKIELSSMDRLIPTARTHSADQVASLPPASTSFGFTKPNSGRYQSQYSRRARGARKLKLGEVPVILLDRLSETRPPACG
jgi:hypothetical protein